MPHLVLIVSISSLLHA